MRSPGATNPGSSRRRRNPLQKGFGFEFANNANFDGGVIEISVDGVNWTDIGRSASPSYNGKITTTSGNPLGGRRAYVRDQSSETVTVNLRNTYANQAVRIRFVIGTDEAVGGFGWQVDNLVFTGLTNMPFATIVPDTNACWP
jgi:large repetitive protein